MSTLGSAATAASTRASSSAAPIAPSEASAATALIAASIKLLVVAGVQSLLVMMPAEDRSGTGAAADAARVDAWECAAASSGAARMAWENLATVLTRATTSDRDSAVACRCSGRSNTLSAVPSPRSCSFPWSLHFWHEMQSITSDML